MCLFGLSCEEVEIFSGMWKWKVAKRAKMCGFSTFWRKLCGFGFFLPNCAGLGFFYSFRVEKAKDQNVDVIRDKDSQEGSSFVAHR